MGNPTYHSILLTSRLRVQRKLRKQLLHFFDLLGLYLQVGYELGFAWNQVLRALKSSEKESLLDELIYEDTQESLNDCLSRLRQNFKDPQYRIHFGTLAQLYQQGAPLALATRSISQCLRCEFERDLENHLRKAPTQAQILLLLFFLPPALILLFMPILQQLRNLF
ncbi:MAG: hypothetical protein EBQ85_08550 [Proteobacteria bacterium]|nr:hypothetical protein [Pseudomonadota bacterium]